MSLYIDDWKRQAMTDGCEFPLDVKLIALDMDGTLLNEHGLLAEESKEALMQAMEQGVHVVIATGRVFSALPQDVVTVPGIEYAITSNGANIIRLKDNETIYSNLIDGSKLDDIMDILEDETIMKEVFYDHQVYAQKSCLEHLEDYGIRTEKSQRYTLTTRQPVEDTLALILENRDKLENINLLFGNEERRQQVWKRLDAVEGITACSSMPYNLEIGGATTSKAAALDALGEILGVTKEQIMACGDSSNDAAMLRHAGISVAMGNAEDEVKAESLMVTKTNKDHGVAYAIRELVLK
ncbi:MAG: HAD family phosphatase [Firmicutes bacterium]|nr:HAD family phosphatase [Bacillota bacterium]MBR4074706.1 HAD family phosphatase [Bacillota bacterium]MBR7147712.1 HAD family phosphatase [Bacillota bacterium]